MTTSSHRRLANAVFLNGTVQRYTVLSFLHLFFMKDWSTISTSSVRPSTLLMHGQNHWNLSIWQSCRPLTLSSYIQYVFCPTYCQYQTHASLVRLLQPPLNVISSLFHLVVSLFEPYFPRFERGMYSILTCRVILDIRTETKESLDWSSPKFSVRLPSRSK